MLASFMLSKITTNNGTNVVKGVVFIFVSYLLTGIELSAIGIRVFIPFGLPLKPFLNLSIAPWIFLS